MAGLRVYREREIMTLYSKAQRQCVCISSSLSLSLLTQVKRLRCRSISLMDYRKSINNLSVTDGSIGQIYRHAISR